MTDYLLCEHESTYIKTPTPTPRVRESIRKSLADRIDVQWLADDVMRIKATSWVGVVKLPNGATIRVQPKLAGSELNVITMLGVAGGIRIEEMPLLEQQIDTTGGDTAIELLCQLLVSAVHDVVSRGVVRNYRDAEGDLTVMRGRLDVNRQMSRHFMRVDRLACRYEEFDHDTHENRIIAAALRVVVQLATNQDLRRRASILGADFDTMSPTPFIYSPSTRQSMTYHRGNGHYRNAHVWAFALLDSFSIDNPFDDVGDRTSTYMIDMNRLFESFVGWLLQQWITDRDTQIRSQSVNRTVLHSTDATWRSIRPDYIVSQGGRHSAIDAKYKLYDQKSVTVADIYQLLVYSQAYPGLGDTPHSILIYPSAGDLKHLRVDLKPETHVLGSVSTVGIPLAALVEAARTGMPLTTTATATTLLRLLCLDSAVSTN